MIYNYLQKSIVRKYEYRITHYYEWKHIERILYTYIYVYADIEAVAIGQIYTVGNHYNNGVMTEGPTQ